ADAPRTARTRSTRSKREWAALPPADPPFRFLETPNTGRRADALRAERSDGIAEAGRLFETGPAKMSGQEPCHERIAGAGRVFHVDVERRGEDLAARGVDCASARPELEHDGSHPAGQNLI